MARAGPAPEEELLNPVTGQTIRFVKESGDTLVIESSYRAGGAPAPAHLHPSQDEHFRVLSGAVRAKVGNEERVLQAGEELAVAAGTAHEFGGLPDEDGTLRWEVRPPLRTREFLEVAFGLARDGRVSPETGAPGPLLGALLAHEYRDVFRLAAVPWAVQGPALRTAAAAARARGITLR